MVTMSTDRPLPKDAPNSWWKGSDYGANSLWQFELANEVVKNYPFKGNEEVLDIGCGDGKVTAIIAKEKVPKGSVLGMDFSDSMVKEAKTKFSDISNVSFAWKDAANFHLNKLFDVILSFSALHWVPEQRAVWKGIREHLKIGGSALVSLNPFPRQKEFAQAIVETIQDKTWSSYFVDFAEKKVMAEMSIEAYRDIILGTGLRVDEYKQTTRWSEFKDRATFVGNLKSWMSHVARIPADLQELFVDDLVTRFLRLTNQDPSQKVKMSYNNFMVKATRIS